LIQKRRRFYAAGAANGATMSNAETGNREIQIVIETVVLKMHEIADRLIN
jgi:hypothetical protein